MHLDFLGPLRISANRTYTFNVLNLCIRSISLIVTTRIYVSEGVSECECVFGMIPVTPSIL